MKKTQKNLRLISLDSSYTYALLVHGLPQGVPPPQTAPATTLGLITSGFLYFILTPLFINDYIIHIIALIIAKVNRLSKK